MMSTLLANHLEQISLCAESIADLEFPGPKMFTNALLAPHDITALIRDTEIHERALFSIAPPPVGPKAQAQQFSNPLSGSTNSGGRQSVAAHGSKQPRKNTAVASVLGGDLYRKVRNAGSNIDSGNSYGSARLREKGEVDVDILLEGAEKLCSVYPIDGAAEKIAALRERYQQLTANIAHYEDRVSRNTKQLGMMQQRNGYDDTQDDDFLADPATPVVPSLAAHIDLEREEMEIRELERKKRGLEERVTGMEKDLGGLMR